MEESQYAWLNKLFVLEKEVVLVTGAAGQLGSYIVRALLHFGCGVVATDISEDKSGRVAGLWQCDNDSAFIKTCAIRQRHDVIDVFRLSAKKIG